MLGSLLGDFQWSELISVLAFLFAVSSFVLSLINRRRVEARDSYVAIERSANPLFTLPIENDDLNRLFYTEIEEDFDDAPEKIFEMDDKQRALFQYGTLVQNYFEQIYRLDSAGGLPDGVLDTWSVWLDECLDAPAFRWVWRCNEGHYLSCLAEQIDSKIANRV